MLPNHAIDSFHSLLMDDAQFNDALSRVAMEVVRSYYAPGEALDDNAYDMAMELCTRVTLA